MANSFRENLNQARSNSYIGAFNRLQAGNNPITSTIGNAVSGAEDDIEAFGRGSKMAGFGTTLLGGISGQLNSLAAEGAARNFQMGSTIANQQLDFDTQTKLNEISADAQADQNKQGFFGALFSTGLKIASAFCERRLKTGIRPIDPSQAWAAVRDLPRYEFQYRHQPGVTAYGPMVDEAEIFAPSLLCSMDAEARRLGINDGEPVRGVDKDRMAAYEASALSLALRRIEELEQRLARLERAAPARPRQLQPLPQFPYARAAA